MSCNGVGESGQKRQKVSGRGTLSWPSSPVITHERVIGSLRSSMAVKETIAAAGASTGISSRASLAKIRRVGLL
jgi:hypothetical protein